MKSVTCTSTSHDLIRALIVRSIVLLRIALSHSYVTQMQKQLVLLELCSPVRAKQFDQFVFVLCSSNYNSLKDNPTTVVIYSAGQTNPVSAVCSFPHTIKSTKLQRCKRCNRVRIHPNTTRTLFSLEEWKQERGGSGERNLGFSRVMTRAAGWDTG